MAQNFRITNLATEEVELLNEVQLRKRFAPDLTEAISAEGSKERQEWVEAFASSPLFQKGYGVSVEKLDPEEVFETAQKNHKAKKTELDQAKAAVDGAVFDILAALSEDEIKPKVHKLSTAKDATSYGLVEYWIRKGTVNLAGLLEKGETLPKHVHAELKSINKTRKANAAKGSK